jgi:hypothetical protein
MLEPPVANEIGHHPIEKRLQNTLGVHPRRYANEDQPKEEEEPVLRRTGLSQILNIDDNLVPPMQAPELISDRRGSIVKRQVRPKKKPGSNWCLSNRPQDSQNPQRSEIIRLLGADPRSVDAAKTVIA